MKKRIEKVVEWIDSTNSFLTKGKKYIEIPTISSSSICVVDDNGRETYWGEERFKVVSEKEVLEFDGLCSWLADKTDQVYAISLEEEVDLRNYDLKVIATPKEEDIEYWKNNAEENYLTTPISVLKYITKLEKLLKSKD